MSYYNETTFKATLYIFWGCSWRERKGPHSAACQGPLEEKYVFNSKKTRGE